MRLKFVLGPQEPLKKFMTYIFFFYSIEKLHVSDTQCISDTLWPIHVSFFEVPGQKSKKNLWPASHYFTWKTRARLFYTLYHLICQTILNIANARCLLPLKSLNLSAITHKLMKIEEPGLWHFKAYNSTFKVSYLTKT